MSALQYQVNSQGEVVKVKEIEGNTVYRLKVTQKSKEQPWTNPRGPRAGRWDEWKRAICSQMPGLWVTWEGFTSEEEVQRAESTLQRYKRDTIFKSALRGRTIEFLVDKKLLRIATLLKEKEFEGNEGLSEV